MASPRSLQALRARLLLVLTALRRSEAQPAQRSQAKLGQDWRIARTRSRQRLGAPTRSTLRPISDSQRLLPSLRPPSRGLIAAIKQNTYGKGDEALISIKLIWQCTKMDLRQHHLLLKK